MSNPWSTYIRPENLKVVNQTCNILHLRGYKSIHQLAKLADLPENTLRRFFAQKGDMNITTFNLLLAHIGRRLTVAIDYSFVVPEHWWALREVYKITHRTKPSVNVLVNPVIEKFFDHTWSYKIPDSLIADRDCTGLSGVRQWREGKTSPRLNSFHRACAKVGLLMVLEGIQ